MSNSVLMSGSIVHDYAEFSQQSVNDIVNKIVKFQELSIETVKIIFMIYWEDILIWMDLFKKLTNFFQAYWTI
jgi:hypothetical protein